MKNKKPNSIPAPDKAKRENPIARMIRDKKRIQEAIAKGIPVASLKDIEFGHPIWADNNPKRLPIYYWFRVNLRALL